MATSSKYSYVKKLTYNFKADFDSPQEIVRAKDKVQKSVTHSSPVFIQSMVTTPTKNVRIEEDVKSDQSVESTKSLHPNDFRKFMREFNKINMKKAAEKSG